MLGNDLFKVESNVDLSYKRRKALILFYNPLIGNDAHYLYEFLCLKDSSSRFYELNDLLNSLRYSINQFEECMKLLNKYRLVNTLKKKDENSYIFILNDPLSIEEFVNDDILPRVLINKTSSAYYQSLLGNAKTFGKHKGFDDVSCRFNPQELSSWTKEKEAGLKKQETVKYNFGTYFDINAFLKGCEIFAFPIKYRTPEVIEEIAMMGDLYNIDLESMRPLVLSCIKTNDPEFDFDLFRYKCQKYISPYRSVEDATYNVPCITFLMSKLNGKEATVLDRKIIFELGHEYHLNIEVINALLEFVLENNDNKLIEKYIYSLANDMHHNDVKTAKECLDRLNGKIKNKAHVFKEPTYDDSKNIKATEEELEALRRMRGQ